MRRWIPIILAVLTFSAVAPARGAEVGVMRIAGTIGPATEGYIARGIEVAASRHYACLIIELDTPGGLLASTEKIVQNLYASQVPTAVYVTPSGAMAGSAGCFITLAADFAVMAPHTSIGAAHPVSAGGVGEQKEDEVMKQKMENATRSFIKGIAEKRGRNAEWAQASVVKSESITAEEAVELKVINFIAKDVPDLLNQIDGREVNGVRLQTAGAATVKIPMSAREHVFALLWRPEVMLILMLAAIYGIIGELSSPGAILPGVVGGIALILALYMASILPINVAGLALMGLAILLFLIDLFAPTHGVLTFGGIIAFFLGALMLFDRSEPAFLLSLAYIIPATLVTAAFFVFVVGAGIRAQFLPARTGRELMLGLTAPALARIDAAGGKIFVEGEYWNAVSEVPIEAGQAVEVVGMDGLTLRVKPAPAAAAART
jgi:membrane-bound serine protease (ClpP class)